MCLLLHLAATPSQDFLCFACVDHFLPARLCHSHSKCLLIVWLIKCDGRQRSWCGKGLQFWVNVSCPVSFSIFNAGSETLGQQTQKSLLTQHFLQLCNKNVLIRLECQCARLDQAGISTFDYYLIYFNVFIHIRSCLAGFLPNHNLCWFCTIPTNDKIRALKKQTINKQSVFLLHVSFHCFTHRAGIVCISTYMHRCKRGKLHKKSLSNCST